jgi:hypothetical protein
MSFKVWKRDEMARKSASVGGSDWIVDGKKHW